MSKQCPFQTREPKIGEARCVIPLTLKPEELKEHCSMGCGSWFCKFYKKEKDCPIIHDIATWVNSLLQS